MKSSRSKIVIGSVQFGLDYGISNQLGKASPEAVTEILDLATQNDIHLIDTASMYGTSEELLGQLAGPQFQIVTKIPAMDFLRKSSAMAPEIQVETCFHSSLQKLKRDNCYGLLLHNADDLLGPDGIAIHKALLKLKGEGKVRKIGVSCYAPEQVEQILKKFDLDLVQFPFNVLDQRFRQNNFLKRLKDKGIELHSRSVFLQGLLLMEPKDLNPYFDSIRPLISSLRDFALSNYGSMRTTLIDMALSVQEIDQVLFGVVQKDQLAEIITDVNNSGSRPQVDWSRFSVSDPAIVNPHLWKLK